MLPLFHFDQMTALKSLLRLGRRSRGASLRSAWPPAGIGERVAEAKPIARVISLINPMLRGWVNYFAVGHSSECFGHIKDWVEKKVRRHLAHAQKRRGFGWERWSRPWLYNTLKLFHGYRVCRDGPKVAPAG